MSTRPNQHTADVSRLRAEEAQQQDDDKQSSEVQARAEQAGQAKAQGNKALKAQQYGEAVQHYSQAIELEASNPAHHNNRALAFLKVLAALSAEPVLRGSWEVPGRILMCP